MSNKSEATWQPNSGPVTDHTDLIARLKPIEADLTRRQSDYAARAVRDAISALGDTGPTKRVLTQRETILSRLYAEPTHLDTANARATAAWNNHVRRCADAVVPVDPGYVNSFCNAYREGEAYGTVALGAAIRERDEARDLHCSRIAGDPIDYPCQTIRAMWATERHIA